MTEKVAVTGDPERLRQLGFLPALPPPPPEDDFEDEDLEETPGESLLVKLGMENAPIEEKARIITDAWLASLTEKDIRKMGAAGADKVAKMAGLGGAKRPDPSGNPIIMAILLALQNLGVKPPALQVIEAEQPTLGAK